MGKLLAQIISLFFMNDLAFVGSIFHWGVDNVLNETHVVDNKLLT